LPRISLSLAHEQGTLSWWQIYTGVALTTLATLVMELSLTRVFSVVFYYHFAFLAISIALFGLGAGGVFSYVVSGWRGGTFGKLGLLASLNSIVVVGSLVFLLSRRGEFGNGTLAAVYFASALPFFFAGTIISLVINETIERVDRVYFLDLLGAAGGCLLLLPFLSGFGGPNTVITVGVLFAASAAMWFNVAGETRWRATAVALALGLVGLFVINLRWSVIDVRFAKGQAIGNEIFTRWNGLSRIGLVEDAGSGGHLIIIDADASTGVPRFDFDNLTADNRKNLLLQGQGLPYSLRPAAKTLIIGPGGGWDVSAAVASGSKDVTGVEVNPLIANTIMRDRFPHLSRNLYKRPEVRIEVEDGRSFVRRSAEKYQVLQATLVDTWASTAAGAFALSENNLYTTDAFYDYLSHLTDDGLMAFTRWGFDPPRESLRLLTLANVALAKLGETEIARHVIIVREGSTQGWGSKDTVLISRKPFSAADIDRAREIVRVSGMQEIYLPGDAVRNEFGRYLLTADKAAFLANYRYDLSPVSDDRPFFFYTVQPRDLWAFLTQGGQDSADYKINRAVPLLFGLMIISVLATIVVLALPPLVLGTKLPKDSAARQFLLYFLCIGAGYILIQVALIQKFVLFLGHPTYALTVIIFSMLVSSGIGSWFSRRLTFTNPVRLRRALCVVFVLVVAIRFIAPALTAAAVGWPWMVKVLLTVALIAPVGFVMGLPFPTALNTLELRFPTAVRWAWSLNAASSVLGSASAIFLAIYIGLGNTLIVGGLFYLTAALIHFRTRRAFAN
jgi:hypothetical protein